MIPSDQHEDVATRTTITLDEDVRAKLKAEMRRTGKSFKETVNEALRCGLVAGQRTHGEKPFEISAWDMGLKPGYNLDKPWELIEEVEGPHYE
jgi:Arc/MetJ family transcription regulator